MAGFARAQVYGRIMGEVKSQEVGGTTITNFTLGASKKNKRGEYENTYVDCSIWGKSGDAFARFHAEGDMAWCEGELKQDTWEDKQTGVKRSKLRLTSGRWEFIKGQEASSQGGSQGRSTYGGDEDAPF